MNKRVLAFGALISFSAFFAPVGAADAGTVTGVSVSPRSIAVGGTVSVTVTGTNPCGAAHIIYSDAAAITYAISGLPTTQTHTYDKPGTYTITAKGMGNCDGEARTTVTVTAPEPPPPPSAPAAEITSVEIAPRPGRIREPVTISVNGTGTCAYELHFGDGNAQDVTGRFPQQFRHTYSRPDTYIVIAKPNPPCTGKFTQVLQVVDPGTQAARIARVVVSPTPANAGQPVTITIEGSGPCRGYTLDFGDGNSEPRAATLPDKTQHVYSVEGRYVIAAVANETCTGDARTSLDVRRRRR